MLRLLRDGWDVVCLIRRNVAPAREKVDCLMADLDDLHSLHLAERLAGPIDVLFHAGAALRAANFGKTEPLDMPVPNIDVMRSDVAGTRPVARKNSQICSPHSFPKA